MALRVQFEEIQPLVLVGYELHRYNAPSHRRLSTVPVHLSRALKIIPPAPEE